MKFASKRNEVFMRGCVVEKRVVSFEAAAFEGAQLQRLFCAGVSVPTLLSCEGSVLRLEHIKGETLPDLIERLEKLQHDTISKMGLPKPQNDLDLSVLFELETVADAIINWLNEFYEAVQSDKTREIRGDVNGRNFLFDGNRCVGVDFEEQVFGTKEQDIGRLVAFVLTYDPQGTEVKAELARKLMQKAVKVLYVDVKEVEHQYDLELMAMQERRNRRYI